MNDNLKGKNVLIDISDDASDDDRHSDDYRYGDDDGYGEDDGLDDYRLNELTEEDVYGMIFDSDDDGERFYNAYAKVKGFSVRKDNIHRDNEATMNKNRGSGSIPRGFPLENVGEVRHEEFYTEVNGGNQYIQQVISNGLLDVDSVFYSIRKSGGEAFDIRFDENAPNFLFSQNPKFALIFTKPYIFPHFSKQPM
ncbi:hypothetical protein RHSIM_Rhsim03G0147000 [Rhododendron simsii]|uniref:Uncharacterized protein n=1 Tax=Rhododendron simsii TaxID=118357 RepID=A0A834H3J2_RHOSS|nr:hypothetical protein RHSIM_Rhsim03G0147000 [Rhododendron simsii]